MDTTFNLNLSVVLTPTWWKDIPVVSYGINNLVINTIPISNTAILSLAEYPLSVGNHCFWIEFNNKDDSNCDLTEGLDMAVEIESVIIEGMTLDRAKWSGEYYPKYPEPWASTQSDLKSVIKSATYLGWNGRWELNFTMPVFTWIHQTESLGWLYHPTP